MYSGLIYASTNKGGGVHFTKEGKNGNTENLCGAKGGGTRTRMPFYTTCKDCQELITPEMYNNAQKEIAEGKRY